MEAEQRPKCLEQELTATLARILDAAPEKLDIDASIENLGLDSLMLTQLRNWILRSLDINLPLIKLLKGPSITTLAADLLVHLANSSSAAGAATKESSQGLTTFTVADLDGVRVLNPWLIRGRSSADAPCRLICFHSMGVGASLFTKFLLNPPESYDILAVQTPGRENRMAEPVAENFDWLADQIALELAPYFDRPVVIWGHSFGGIVAWEVVRRLRERHQMEPLHFMVTGTETPTEIYKWPTREIMLKGMVKDNSPEYLMSLSRYVDDPEFFMKTIVPGMRRDYPLLLSYRYHPGPLLNCPITAFAARRDDMVYTDVIRDWVHFTYGGFELIEVDGDHWFLDRNRDRIIAKLHEIAAGTMTRHGPHRALSAPARSASAD
jgi:surfactin synthase thioesterase subunit/acyl carrier protein